MKNRKHDGSADSGGSESHEAIGPMPIKEIAHHIAILVVHQHRRLKTCNSKKSGGNAL